MASAAAAAEEVPMEIEESMADDDTTATETEEETTGAHISAANAANHLSVIGISSVTISEFTKQRGGR